MVSGEQPGVNILGVGISALSMRSAIEQSEALLDTMVQLSGLRRYSLEVTHMGLAIS